MGQGEREFTRRGKIHETRSKASNTARTGPTGGRRDRLSRFTRRRSRAPRFGRAPGPTLAESGGKILPCQGCSLGSGTGAGGRSGGGDAPRARLGRRSPHVALDSTERSSVREVVRGSWRAPQSLVRPSWTRETNRLIDRSAQTFAPPASNYRCDIVAKASSKTHNQPAKSTGFHDWFPDRCRRGASARGIPGGARRGRVSSLGTSPGHLCDIRSASDRRHVSKVTPSVGQPPWAATEVDGNSLQPTGARRQPSTRRAIGANLGCLRIVRAGHAPEPDFYSINRASAAGFVAISASSSSPPRFRRYRYGDRKSANPPFGDSLFSAGGAHADRRVRRTPASASDRHVPAPPHQQIKGAPPSADDEPEMTEEERQLADGVAKLAATANVRAVAVPPRSAVEVDEALGHDHRDRAGVHRDDHAVRGGVSRQRRRAIAPTRACPRSPSTSSTPSSDLPSSRTCASRANLIYYDDQLANGTYVTDRRKIVRRYHAGFLRRGLIVSIIPFHEMDRRGPQGAQAAASAEAGEAAPDPALGAHPEEAGGQLERGLQRAVARKIHPRHADDRALAGVPVAVARGPSRRRMTGSPTTTVTLSTRTCRTCYAERLELNNELHACMNLSPWNMYIAALYWALVTMSTIGYGDVIADANRGAFLCHPRHAHRNLGVCLRRRQRVRDRREHGQEEQRAPRAHGHPQRDVPGDAGWRRAPDEAPRFFRYRHTSTNIEEWFELLELMSPSLRGEVALKQCGSWINNVPFFSGAPDGFIVDIALKLKTETFPQGEEIVHAGQISTKMYIVERGVVGGKGRVFTSGKVFGEEVLGGSPAAFTARAMTYCDVFGLLGNGSRRHGGVVSGDAEAAAGRRVQGHDQGFAARVRAGVGSHREGDQG